jgi:hypothetical protein
VKITEVAQMIGLMIIGSLNLQLHTVLALQKATYFVLKHYFIVKMRKSISCGAIFDSAGLF